MRRKMDTGGVKKSVTSDNSDGGPTLSIAVRVHANRDRSKKSCFQQELSSREEMDDGILCQGCILFCFKYMSCISCLWFDNAAADLFHFNDVWWTTKLVGKIMTLIATAKRSFCGTFGATPACRSSQATCSQLCHNFLALGRGDTWLPSQVSLSTLCLYKRLSDGKNSHHLLSAM